MASTVHLLTSTEKVEIGFEGVLGLDIIVGCASLASPVLHPPVQPGPPASPEGGLLSGISPSPNICTVFAVTTVTADCSCVTCLQIVQRGLA